MPNFVATYSAFHGCWIVKASSPEFIYASGRTQYDAEADARSKFQLLGRY